jgi:hypothetical protein
MKQDVRLVVTEIVNGVVSVVRVREGADFKLRKAVQIQNFFEIAYFVG